MLSSLETYSLYNPSWSTYLEWDVSHFRSDDSIIRWEFSNLYKVKTVIILIFLILCIVFLIFYRFVCASLWFYMLLSWYSEGVTPTILLKLLENVQHHDSPPAPQLHTPYSGSHSNSFMAVRIRTLVMYAATV